MGKSINAIIQAIADTQVEKKDTAYVHCHADQILLGNNIYWCTCKTYYFGECLVVEYFICL